MWLAIGQPLHSFYSPRNESQGNYKLLDLSLVTQQTNHRFSVQSVCVCRGGGVLELFYERCQDLVSRVESTS